MKRFLALCLALSLVLTLAPALGEEEKVLNIFSWEGYVDETTIANFTAETGISINYAVFASNEEMLMKLQANGASEYDIIIASDYILSLARKENLLLPLDKEQLTGWENLNPAYLDQYFDPGNVYTMPYTVGVPMIVYDPARVAEPITSFDDLWREEFRDNLCLLDDARVMIGAVLKTLGYSYNTTDDAELAEAKEKVAAWLERTRPLQMRKSPEAQPAATVKETPIAETQQVAGQEQADKAPAAHAPGVPAAHLRRRLELITPTQR